MSNEADIAEEQAFLDRSYGALDAMREEAKVMLDEVIDRGQSATLWCAPVSLDLNTSKSGTKR